MVTRLSKSFRHFLPKFRSFCAPASSSTTTANEAANDPRIMAFFEDPKDWGESELKTGRSWSIPELRRKSNSDLHKLWYVLLKERNVLLTHEDFALNSGTIFPNPERIDKVEISMENLESVVRERNRAVSELETGETGDRPTKVVTTFLGFRVEQPLKEFAEPAETNSTVEKQYEVPYLDDDAYQFQKLWKEKQFKEERDKEDDLKRIKGQHKFRYRN